MQYGHGVGLSIWERPIFSRMISFDHPEVLEEGMVFALETYWPAADGWSASRIEEEVVVTADGCEVITSFPAEELLVCGTRYWTMDAPLPTLRESQSHLNTAAGRGRVSERSGRGGSHEREASGWCARRPMPSVEAAPECRVTRRGVRTTLGWTAHEAMAGRTQHDLPTEAAMTAAWPGTHDVVLPEPFDPALDDADIDLDTRLALYRCQQEIRQLERRLHDLFLQNLVKGTSHLATGMEAAAAAFGVALRSDDYTFATYRGHGHTVARGVPPGPIIAEMLGRGTGLLGGKGGSMHLTSVEHGMMGSYAIVGAHLCIANGAAWSARLRGTDQVAVAFFGDGATNIGAFHEALNFAAVYQLPAIFVCENNLYMEYTAIGEVTAVRHPAADRAAAYGLEPTVVDGNDADAVYLAAQAAIGRARAGGGPSLIETKTYRHGGHSRADPGTYRPDEEIEAWMAHDPIPMYHQRLLRLGVAEAELADIVTSVAAAIDAATEEAKAAAPPDPAELWTNVWADGGWQWRS